MRNFLEKQKRTRLVRLINDDNALIKTKLPKYTINIDKVVDLGFKDGYFVKQVTYTFYLPIKYEELVNKLVKERYSDSDEFAILRKAMIEKTNEYYIYNAYVEDCKTRAKEFIAERERVLNE